MTARLTDRISANIQSRVPSGDLEEGTSTIEYVIGTIAAAVLAGLLLTLMKTGWVAGFLKHGIASAFKHMG